MQIIHIQSKNKTTDQRFDSTMAEKQLSVTDYRNRKRIKQTVSVPFLWEEKPGIPKRNWKPNSVPVNPIVPTPIKLIASIPFHWEEEPGKPFPSFSLPSPEPPLLMLEWVEKPQTPPEPPLLLEWEEKPGKSLPSWEDGNFDSDHVRGEMTEPALEAWDLETYDDSFSSAAPYLLANRLVPTAALSSAIPAQGTSMMDNHSAYLQAPSSPAWESHSGYLQAPSSPAWETDSSTSSYATGTTSLVGAPFLECLFPLLTPSSSFLDKVNGCSGKGFSHSKKAKDFDLERNCSSAVRNPLTLGELIMMSRRRSIRRKAVQMQEQNLSMVIFRLPIRCYSFIELIISFLHHNKMK